MFNTDKTFDDVYVGEALLLSSDVWAMWYRSCMFNTDKTFDDVYVGEALLLSSDVWAMWYHSCMFNTDETFDDNVFFALGENNNSK